jgi:hypothetical protein
MITQPVTFVLALTEPEREELLRLLEQELTEVHAERRRTEAPDYRDQLRRRETLIQGLVGRLRPVGG